MGYNYKRVDCKSECSLVVTLCNGVAPVKGVITSVVRNRLDSRAGHPGFCNATQGAGFLWRHWSNRFCETEELNTAERTDIREEKEK